MARYCDHVAYYDYCTIVAGSGNNKNGYVASQALAYNVIAVGGIDDKNTPSWSDDEMWNEAALYGSSYVNPVDGREKPKL